MRPIEINIAMLQRAADGLGHALCDRVVFVGGAVVGLLVTDPGQPAVRPTDDVDVVIPVAALGDDQQVEDLLRARGLTQCPSPPGPICRWYLGDLAIDVMPTLEAVLGFSSKWYPLAANSAQWHTLPSGTRLRVISAPAFIATKLEAFSNRGRGDYLASHDLGDVIAIVDGRQSLAREIADTDAELRRYIGTQLGQLMSRTAFQDALPGHLPPDAASQERLPEIVSTITSIIGPFAVTHALRGAVTHFDKPMKPATPSDDWDEVERSP